MAGGEIQWVKFRWKNSKSSALAALNSAFHSSPVPKPVSAPRSGGKGQESQRAAALAALSFVLTAEKNGSPDVSSVRLNTSPSVEASRPAPTKIENPQEVENSKEASEVKETETVEPFVEANGEDSKPNPEREQNENSSESSQTTFHYEQLEAKSDYPVTGIDFKRREAYLSNEEFQVGFGLTKEAFYKLPKWKQDMQKKKFDLF